MAPTRQRLADVSIAAALTGLSLLILAGFPDLPWPPYALAFVHTTALALRRTRTVPAAAVALVAAAAYGLGGYPVVGLGPAALVWAYSVGAEVARPWSLVALAATEATAAFVVWVGQGDGTTIIGDVVALAVAFLLGDATRRRGEVLALHRDRADQLERAQSEVARRAIAEERLRIARELHDVVAHGMSVIAVQASTARLVVDRDTDRARQALEVIEQASRDALDEMRSLLGVLRDEQSANDRRPAPSLLDLDELVARTAAQGISVRVEVEGERRPLPPGLELAGFRILQEALTNAARHAPGAEATVRLTYHDDGLAIEVVNTGGTRRAGAGDGGASSTGLGLVGVRERASLYGGTVEAGPLAGGGYRLATRLRGGARS